MRFVLGLVLVSFSLGLNAQTGLYLKFPPKVAGLDYTLTSTVQDLSGNHFSVDDFNYYLSNIHIIHDGGQDLDLSDTVLLVKADANEFYMGDFNVTNIEQINFGVGVPQELNHLDITQYPTGHMLSFQSPSMHWGWTAGYKILLCDGMGDSNGDGAPDVLFQLHNLGDANYKNVQLPVIGTNYGAYIDLIVDCNIDEWIYGADPGSIGILHGEFGVNQSTMNNVNDRSVFSQPLTASNIEFSKIGKLYFVNQLGGVEVVWEDLTGLSRYSLVDMKGGVVQASSLSEVNGSMRIENITSGQYLLRMLDEDGRELNTIKIVQ